MKDHQIRRLVVLDNNQHLAGVLSLGDISVHCKNELTRDALESISQH